MNQNRRSDRHFINYPSGKSFEAVGTFGLAQAEDMLIPTITSDQGAVLILDQRSLITANGLLVYSPHTNRDSLSPVMTKWLKENPTWGKHT